MKLKKLTTAMLLSTLPTAGAFAAAMDRSGQSMSAFFQPGNYFEAGISVLDPTVKGQEIQKYGGRHIDDMADSYYFPSAALKLQVSDQFSLGILYDQPFGAKAEYHGNNAFVATPKDPVLGDKLRITSGELGVSEGNTKVEVDTQNLSLVLGYQPTKNWNIYGGPVYQTVKGNVSLRGSAYSLYNGYDADIKETGGFGWLAGAAYQIPEIALKASLTYRSKIDHDVNIRESIAMANTLAAWDKAGMLKPTLEGMGAGYMYPLVKNALNANEQEGKTTITTPQSVNLDFQTGIMADTVAFANVRWVNWKDFSIQPYKFGKVSEAIGGFVNRPNGFNLVEYSKDQWHVNMGVGRKLSEKWAGNVSVGWDSGAGNPVTTLGPTEGFWDVGVGLQYSPTPQTFIAGGVKYFWLGDAKAQTGAQAGGSDYVAEFSDNKAIAYGLKLGYRF